MKNYILIEKQNLNSTREGKPLTAKNLTGAKIKANKMQCFHGTVLEITSEKGKTLAVKESNRWMSSDEIINL